MTTKRLTELNTSWKFKETFPTISAYTTTSNCIEGGYPFEDAIRSFSWCDEIVVCDNFSKDGTREKLEELKKDLPQLQVYDIAMSGEPDQDGAYKAMSRAMCMSDYLIQFDSDEICMGSSEKWKNSCNWWSRSIKCSYILRVIRYREQYLGRCCVPPCTTTTISSTSP